MSRHTHTQTLGCREVGFYESKMVSFRKGTKDNCPTHSLPTGNVGCSFASDGYGVVFGPEIVDLLTIPIVLGDHTLTGRTSRVPLSRIVSWRIVDCLLTILVVVFLSVGASVDVSVVAKLLQTLVLVVQGPNLVIKGLPFDIKVIGLRRPGGLGWFRRLCPGRHRLPAVRPTKRHTIMIKIPFCDWNSSHKTRSGNIQLISATRTSFYNRDECRREKDWTTDEKSLNLEISLKSEVWFPSTLQLRR
jgi:hypothetical protein